MKNKPYYLVIEDLAVSNLMKNKHLSKAIASQKFFEFITKLTSKFYQNNIELRMVYRFYPSSKTCSCCGKIKKDLNTSINLKNAKKYKIA